MASLLDSIKSLYLGRRFFLSLLGVLVCFLFAYVWPTWMMIGQIALLLVVGTLLADTVALYRFREGISAQRRVAERLSNGDPNPVRIPIRSRYPFPVYLEVIDECPVQFQVRDSGYTLTLQTDEERGVEYVLRPVERGSYDFGAINVYVQSPVGFIRRRFRFEAGRSVPVYPSYLQMRRYEFLAISNRLTEVGVKKIRKVGHTMEFDHIREYVVGDDQRTVNWRATARRGSLHVNQYRDERSQAVYSLVDMGRVMKMPFEKMALLDYAINATLVLSNIALIKQDRAGLIAFSKDIETVVAPRKRERHIFSIQEALYNLQTDFKESDYARLYTHIRRHVRQRSLLVLYTNFETRSSMQRQLPYLRALARQHVVVVVFFENTELRTLLAESPTDLEGIYIKAIAEKFAFEKREIVHELNRYGIQTVLTAPQDLTVNTINKYLALKARKAI